MTTTDSHDGLRRYVQELLASSDRRCARCGKLVNPPTLVTDYCDRVLQIRFHCPCVDAVDIRTVSIDRVDADRRDELADSVAEAMKDPPMTKYLKAEGGGIL